MNTIVFDIETIAQNFDSFDKKQQEYLLKFSETEEEQKLTKENLALWGMTNQIIAIGMLSAETQKGAVYFCCPGQDTQEFEENGIKYVGEKDEKGVLERFWQAISYADKFVTFNGRGFDCPVVILRSAALQIKPTKNLLPNRYYTDQHIDLLDQLQFYGAHRKFNLDFYCKAFGIDSPKAGGITGLDVPQLFAEQEYERIARYCVGDVIATRKLYLHWQKYISCN